MTVDAAEQLIRIHIGKTIETFRKNKGISRAALGSVVGVHRNTVEHWEKGLHSIPAEKLVLVANAINVKIGKLFP